MNMEPQINMESQMNIAAPKYYIVKNDLMELIKNKIYPVNSLLPSEKELMDRYHVSRITVRKALDELVAEGYVYKIHGKGSYVRMNRQSNIKLSRKLISCSEEIRRNDMVPRRRRLNQMVVPCSRFVADALKLEAGEGVLWFERLYYADDIPITYANSYINLRYLKGLEEYDLEKMSMFSIVNDIYKYEIERSYREFEAVAASAMLSKELEVTEGYPLLQVRSISNCVVQGTSHPFEVNTSCYKTDMIRFVIGEE